MYTENDRIYLVDYYMRTMSDIIPYDDPNYENKLRSMAESYADSEIYGDKDFIEMCNEHDKTMNITNGEITIEIEVPDISNITPMEGYSLGMKAVLDRIKQQVDFYDEFRTFHSSLAVDSVKEHLENILEQFNYKSFIKPDEQ